MARIVALVSLIAVLGLINWSIYKKEDHLATGRIVYLKLAPVDPRSLMQGDYMALRFGLSLKVYDALPNTEEKRHWWHDVDTPGGYVIVQLDERNIGSFKALYTGQALGNNEMLMRYRVRNDTVKFATNAFFFQEGHAQYYEPARYGQFRANRKGELLLVAMYDKDLKKLGPEESSQEE
jgi:uncharacterized membrane-anchored protein